MAEEQASRQQTFGVTTYAPLALSIEPLAGNYAEIYRQVTNQEPTAATQRAVPTPTITGSGSMATSTFSPMQTAAADVVRKQAQQIGSAMKKANLSPVDGSGSLETEMVQHA